MKLDEADYSQEERWASLDEWLGERAWQELWLFYENVALSIRRYRDELRFSSKPKPLIKKAIPPDCRMFAAVGELYSRRLIASEDV